MRTISMPDPTPYDVIVSLAGHDRGKLFQVVGWQEDRVLLCDGKNRRLTNPKRKSPKHVRVALRVSEKPESDRAVRTTLALAARSAAKEERQLGER